MYGNSKFSNICSCASHHLSHRSSSYSKRRLSVSLIRCLSTWTKFDESFFSVNLNLGPCEMLFVCLSELENSEICESVLVLILALWHALGHVRTDPICRYVTCISLRGGWGSRLRDIFYFIRLPPDAAVNVHLHLMHYRF